MKKQNKQPVYIVITQTTGIGGELIQPDTPEALQLVPAAEARNLLDRKRARLATEDDGAPVVTEDDEGAPAGPAGSDLTAQLAGMSKRQLIAAAKQLGLVSVGANSTSAEITDAILAAAAEAQ